MSYYNSVIKEIVVATKNNQTVHIDSLDLKPRLYQGKIYWYYENNEDGDLIIPVFGPFELDDI